MGKWRGKQRWLLRTEIITGDGWVHLPKPYSLLQSDFCRFCHTLCNCQWLACRRKLSSVNHWCLFMVALWNRADHYIFALWFLLSIFFFSSPNLSSRRLDVCYTSTHGVALVRIGCRSEMCCMRLAENAGRKKSPKSRHLRTIVQLCRAISSQLRHALTIGKTLVKQQYLHQMSPQYGELRPTSGQDRSSSLGHPN